jgi:hypothetical protein
MYVTCKLLCASLVLVVLGIAFAGVATADINIPAGIGLPEPLYFMTPGGEPIQVPAGLYHVDTAENWLELSPIGGTRVDGIVVEATVASHDNALSTERAFLMATSKEHPELQSLLLYRPDGTAYEAVGSQTGVWSRGWQSMFKHARKRRQPAAKGTRNVPKELFRQAQRAGKQVYKRVKSTRNKEKEVMKMIMQSKNQAADAVVKMMQQNFAAQQKLQGAVRSRGVAPTVSVEECTNAAKDAMAQEGMNEP